jgi:DNA gyrase subunit A
MENEHVTTFVPVREFSEDASLILATKNGIVKKSSLMDYSRPRSGGIKGIVLDEDDNLIHALLSDGSAQIIIATKQGMAIRFDENDVREIGRVSRGVRGIALNEGDEVVSMIEAEPERTVLTVTEHGYGKRTPVEEYRLINRGGKGVINIQTSERNGNVVAVRAVDDERGVVLISEKGIIIRTRADQISVIGRNTQGVRIMRLEEDDKVAGISVITPEEGEEDDAEGDVSEEEMPQPS